MNIIRDKYMEAALREAKLAFEEGEVPVGAVIVKEGEIIASAHNLVENNSDPTAHAEMLAIRAAAEKLGNSRLTGCSMYVTLEPCSMCAGALIWSRIDKLYIGAMDPKAGACGSVVDLVDSPKFNHRIIVETGIMEEECEALLKDFFRELRLTSN